MPDNQMSGNKSRILFLLRYLQENTDDEHIISTNELISLFRGGIGGRRQHAQAAVLRRAQSSLPPPRKLGGGLSRHRGNGAVHAGGVAVYTLKALS